MNMEWVDGAAISVALRDGEVTLSANRAGLLSIARQLSALAEAAPGATVDPDSPAGRAAALGLPIYPVESDGFALWDAICGLAPDPSAPRIPEETTEYYIYNQ